MFKRHNNPIKEQKTAKTQGDNFHTRRQVSSDVLNMYTSSEKMNVTLSSEYK